jgi:NitT/TauT family transport system substrate-binding protein
MRLLTALLLLLALLPGLAAAETLRVGTWKTAQTIQPFFYQEFLPAPLTAEVFAFTNPVDQKTALLAGSLDLAGTTLAHAIQSAVLGQPVVLVAALCHKSSALVVGRDGPIRAIDDLRGRRVGYAPGTMHEILLRETLHRAGLDAERDLSLVRVDFFDMGTALARGSIDGFLSGEPLPSLAVARGYGRILAYPYFAETLGTINAGLLVTRATIANHPDRVQALVTAHARATETLVRDRDRWLGRAADFGTPPEVTNMELSWRMDDTFFRQLKALGERMQRLGLIDRQPDYDQLVDRRFVDHANEQLR